MANRTLFNLVPIGDTKFVHETMLTQRNPDELRIHTNEATETGDNTARIRNQIGTAIRFLSS
jgi:hypothetical protein